MKIRSLLFALSTLALATPAVAQDAPRTYTVPEQTVQQPMPRDPVLTTKPGGGLMEEQDYVWLSRHFYRPGPDANGDNTDSNRIFLYMPWDIGIEIRGFGTMFAPGVFYNMFNTIPNDTTGLLRNQDGEVINDITYYEQFKDAREFTISGVIGYWFKNPNGGTPLAGAKFYIFRSPTGVNDATFFNSTASTGYRSRGAIFDRDNLPIAFEADIDPEGIDTSINGGFINPIVFEFDPPLTFAAGTFAIPMFINDEAEALTGLGSTPGDVRDYQNMASFWDRRRGTTQGYGTNQGWKNMGLTLFRPKGEFSTDKDTIYSIWRALVFGQAPNQIPAHITPWINILGTVDINASIRYHFGREASSQGLGAPTPNPVTTTSRIPFSLTEVSNISLDLFDASGNHVTNIVTARYVPGNYTAALPVADLANGTYLVRLTAGENVYTMKVNVAK
jgi:hypothetical protein